jgi:hypothetical protein
LSLDGRALVLMKKPNLASFICGVEVLSLGDWRTGVACSINSSPCDWLVLALFFVAGVIFLLAFAVITLFCCGETLTVALLGGVRIGYLALSACTTFAPGSSDSMASENYAVSITIMLMKTTRLT